MEKSYRRSITNNLLIELCDYDIHFTVTNKLYQPILKKSFHLIALDTIEVELANIEEISDIFGNTHILSSNSPFHLIPPSIINKQEKEQLYSIVNTIKPDHDFCTDYLQNQIEIQYMVSTKILGILKNKYPASIHKHELSYFYKKVLNQIITDISSSIHASLNDNQLLVVAINNKKLLLANYYTIKSTDDLFYYIMMVIEELKLDSIKTSLFWNGHRTKLSFSIKELFQNYIGSIEIETKESTSSPALNSFLECV